MRSRHPKIRPSPGPMKRRPDPPPPGEFVQLGHSKVRHRAFSSEPPASTPRFVIEVDGEPVTYGSRWDWICHIVGVYPADGCSSCRDELPRLVTEARPRKPKPDDMPPHIAERVPTPEVEPVERISPVSWEDIPDDAVEL